MAMSISVSIGLLFMPSVVNGDRLCCGGSVLLIATRIELKRQESFHAYTAHANHASTDDSESLLRESRAFMRLYVRLKGMLELWDCDTCFLVTELPFLNRDDNV
jgi:hypothetical protein